MRVLEGEQTRVRIYIAESDTWQREPLTQAILHRLCTEGVAGATVMRGTVGFGSRHVIHLADQPVLIEVVDDQEHVDRVLKVLDEMLHCGALVTTERVHVVRYGPARHR
ncbi:MAG TPA: DUF190 domain-containing protein [Kofleriaceae bacterium]|nr:DUF190 domain-containing protein [Kofleriaceae bacterium]